MKPNKMLYLVLIILMIACGLVPTPTALPPSLHANVGTSNYQNTDERQFQVLVHLDTLELADQNYDRIVAIFDTSGGKDLKIDKFSTPAKALSGDVLFETDGYTDEILQDSPTILRLTIYLEDQIVGRPVHRRNARCTCHGLRSKIHKRIAHKYLIPKQPRRVAGLFYFNPMEEPYETQNQ